MSLSGATRAFGSSIIDGSYLDAGWAAPGGGHLFTGSRTPGKGCAAPAAPRKCALLGAQSGPEGHDRMASPMGSKRWKIVVYEPLTQDFALPPRRQLVPVRPIFFLIYQFNFRPLGIISGLGITRFRLAWKVRALTRLSPWGGLRARRFQRDVSAQSDRQGGLSLGGTAGHRGATSARRRGIAPDSHATAAVAAGARQDAAPTDDRADVAPASDRSRAAAIGNRVGRDTFPRHVWAQDRCWRLGRGHSGFGHHELPRPRTSRDRGRARY